MIFTHEQLLLLHGLLEQEDEDGNRPQWISAANMILAAYSLPSVVEDNETANKVIRKLLQDMLDQDDYLGSATLLWGNNQFKIGPQCTKDVFRVIKDNSMTLLQGASSMSKTYSAGAWCYLDWRRDPRFTSIKVAALSEDHLRKNIFSHIHALHQGASIPYEDQQDIKDIDLYFGLRSAGNEFGFSGVAFKQSSEASGHFKGYKSKPVKRSVEHPQFGYMSRVRILGDECFPAGQMVKMADGSSIPIEEIVENRITQKVLSYNTHTGKVEAKKITGWHTVSRRGRRLVNIGGATMTEDHPVFTRENSYELACNVSSLGLHYLKLNECTTKDIKTNEGANLDLRWKPTWRRFDISDQRSHVERSHQIWPRDNPIGLPEVEEGETRDLRPIRDSGASVHGVRGRDVLLQHSMPRGVHEAEDDIMPRWNSEGQKNIGSNASISGPASTCRVVHGRRQQLHNRWVSICDNIDVCVSDGGPRTCRCASENDGPNHENITQQGEIRSEVLPSRVSQVSGYGGSVHAGINGVQGSGREVPGKAEHCTPIQRAHDDAMRDMRDRFSKTLKRKNLLQGVFSETPPNTREQGREEGESVYCIDVEDNHNFFINNVLTHNCQNWPPGPFQDFATQMASMHGVEFYKIILAYNPESVSQRVVELAMPEQGWQTEDMETLYEWVSKEGWHVLRLDAKLCENVVQRKVLYDGFQTYEGFLKLLKGEGDVSNRYATFCRGWPPLKSQNWTIIPASWPATQRGEAIFDEIICNCVSVDCAYQGMDKVIMTVGRFGYASGWTKANGETVKFMDPVNPKLAKHRPLLQYDQQISLMKTGSPTKLAEEIKGKCLMMGIDPKWVAIDATGQGSGTASWLKEYWGDILAIEWNRGATEMKVLAEDTGSAKDKYDRLVSELWFGFKEWLCPDVCAILIHPQIGQNPLNTQLTTRRFRYVKAGKMAIEDKMEFKTRNQRSPDEADSMVQLVYLIRSRAQVLPGMAKQIDNRKPPEIEDSFTTKASDKHSDDALQLNDDNEFEGMDLH